MKAFDARCLECGDVHIVWVGWGHEEGDIVGYSHRTGGRDCPGYGDHELLWRCDGLSTHDKWGPEDTAA